MNRDALSLLLSAFSALSLSCTRLPPTSSPSLASSRGTGQNLLKVLSSAKPKRGKGRRRRRTKTCFFVETKESAKLLEARAWTTTRSIRDARDVFEKLEVLTSFGDDDDAVRVAQASVKQRVSKEDVLVTTKNMSAGVGAAVVETFESPPGAENNDDDFRTMVEIVVARKDKNEEDIVDERTVISVVEHLSAMLGYESGFDEKEYEGADIDVVLKRNGSSPVTIEGKDWNRIPEDDNSDNDEMEEDEGVGSVPIDIVAKADSEGCEVTLVFSRTKEAELRVGNDTRGTVSSWRREEEDAEKTHVRMKKWVSLNPVRIGSEEAKVNGVLFQLPWHFWSRFGFHPIRRRRESDNGNDSLEEEHDDGERTENASFSRVFDTPDFVIYVYDDDEADDDEAACGDDAGGAAEARGERREGGEGDNDGVDLEEEMELLDLRKQVQESSTPQDFAGLKTNEEEMDAHNIQHLQELFLRDVCVVWRQSKKKTMIKNGQEEESASPSVLAQRLRNAFEKAFVEAKRKNRSNFTSKRERREWRIGERIMRNAANIYRNAVVNTDLMKDVARADENIEDWEGKICTLLCQKRAFGQMRF